jgi:hypothetical protein
MVDEEPTIEPTPQAPREPNDPEQPQGPDRKRADVLRDFRKTLADRQRPGGGKFNKPAGGNPRFR